MPELVSKRSRRSGADSSARARTLARQASRPGSGAGARGSRVSYRSRHAITRRRSPTSTFSPTATATRSIVPSRGARSSFCIFIASRTSSCWPAVTSSPEATFSATILPGMMARTSTGPPAGPSLRPRRARSRRDARTSARSRRRPASHRRPPRGPRPRPACAARPARARAGSACPAPSTSVAWAPPSLVRWTVAAVPSTSTPSGERSDDDHRIAVEARRPWPTETRDGPAGAHRGHRSVAASRPSRRQPERPSGRGGRPRAGCRDRARGPARPGPRARPPRGRSGSPQRALCGPIPVLGDPAGREVARDERAGGGRRTGRTAASSGCRRPRSRRAPGAAGRWRPADPPRGP